MSDSTPVSEGQEGGHSEPLNPANVDTERRFEIHAANVVGDVVRTLDGERLYLGERITVVPESRATDAEADAEAQRKAHRLTLGGMKIVADRCEAAEAERDRLREALKSAAFALQRIEERLNPGKTGNPKGQWDTCLRIAQEELVDIGSALTTGTDDARQAPHEQEVEGGG